MKLTKTQHRALLCRLLLPSRENVGDVMNDAKGGHTHGRKEEGGADSSGAPFTFFALCLAVALFTVLQVTPIAGRASAGGRRHSSFHGITRPRPKVSLPLTRSPHVACAAAAPPDSFGSERQVREDNRIRHRYKTNRKGGGGFHRAEGRRDGWKEGEWVVAAADAGHTALHAWHRWRPAAATMTHGAEYWGGLHFSTDFTRHARWTRPREGARRSLA